MTVEPDTDRAAINLRAALAKLHDAEESIPIGWSGGPTANMRRLLAQVDALVTAALLAIGGKVP